MRQSPLPVRVLVTLSCLISTGPALTAQMSGNYTIDANGSGARNYKTLNAAAVALEKVGVNGPACFAVASGTHQGPWVITPIKGTSATNTVTFKALRTVVKADTRAMAVEFKFAHPTTPVRWITLDGFTLEGLLYGQLARTSPTGLDHIVIRNCHFPQGQGVILYGTDHDIHHNTFKSLGTRYSQVSLDRAAGSKVHHNVLHGGWITANGVSGRGDIQIYNNLIYDVLNRPAVRLTDADRSTVAHNTMIVNPINSFAVVECLGASVSGISLLGNIIVSETSNRAKAALIKTNVAGIRSDGNVFDAPPGGDLVVIGSSKYTTMSAWQLASGQDRNSVRADPRFKRRGFDYRLEFPASPAIDKAVGTPSFVLDDLAGNGRDKKPDAGCYEVPPFDTFGAGCFGTGLHVPQMGSSGSPAMGSKNFAFTLRNALGGTRAFFVLGESITKWNGVPLPLTFGNTCQLRVAGVIIHPLFTTGTRPGNGAVDLKAILPSGPSWRDRVFFAQWAVADSYAPQGLSFSNAGRLALR